MALDDETSTPKSPKIITLLTYFLDALTDKITKMILQTAGPSSTLPTLYPPSTKDTISEELNQAPSVKFDEKNYWLWAQTVNIYLDSKKMLGYINGKTKKPMEDDIEFEKWHTEDAMDIHTKEIIGRGAKHGRLYHLEDLKVGHEKFGKFG